MGILNTPLGINLTNMNPLLECPMEITDSEGSNTPPPIGFFIISETGNFLITETGGNLLVVE